jgi:hypothetical protein
MAPKVPPAGRPLSHPSSRVVAVAYGASVVAILASYLWACSSLGFRYPTPWYDEGAYLWPAISIQRHGTLIAPQLNPERPLMGMPHGYMVVQGLVFKLTGFSFEWARTLSALYVAAGTGLLSLLFWRLSCPFASLLFCAVFLHSPIALMVGNVARMEGLLFLFMSASLLLRRGQIISGHDPARALIHPNGLYLLLGAAAYWLRAFFDDRSRCRPSLLDLAAIAAALLPWVVYLVYVSIHWDAFLNDMTVSFANRGGRGLLATAQSRLPERALAIPGLLMIGAALGGFRRNRPALILLVSAAPLFLLSATARGWPFEFHLAAIYPLVSALLIGVVVGEPSKGARARPGLSRSIHAVVLALLLAGLDAWAFRNEEPLSRSVRAATKEEAVSSRIPYVTDSDRQAVEGFLRRQTARGPVTIMFFPQADALLFADLESEELRFVQPAFRHVSADVVVLHESRHLPDWIRTANLSWASHNQGIRRPVDTWRLLHERDDTERWRAAATKPWW